MFSFNTFYLRGINYIIRSLSPSQSSWHKINHQTTTLVIQQPQNLQLQSLSYSNAELHTQISSQKLNTFCLYQNNRINPYKLSVFYISQKKHMRFKLSNLSHFIPKTKKIKTQLMASHPRRISPRRPVFTP